MKIWLTQTGECYPFQGDVILMRTGMLAKTLVERGHSVVWWGSNFYHAGKIELSNGYKEISENDRYQINLLKGVSYKKNFSLKRFVGNKILAKGFRKKILEKELPDVIVASMPLYDLAYEAVKFGSLRDIPVLIDVRDLWPDNIINRLPVYLKYLGRLCLFRDFQKLRHALKNCDGIVAVSKGFMGWALKNAERDQRENDRIFYIGAQKLVAGSYSDLNENFKNLLDATKNKKTFVFLGTFGRSYELLLLANAARLILEKERNDIHFILAGTGEFFDQVKDASVDLKNFSLVGWLEQNEAQKLLASAYVGINPVRSIADTINNKAMQYFSYGLPVISSLEGEMVEILKRENVGLSYTPGDLTALVENILKLADDSKFRNQMAKNAEVVFKNIFEAKVIYEKYAKHIEDQPGFYAQRMRKAN